MTRAGRGSRWKLPLRLVVAFFLALLFWTAFSRPYERVLAAAAETLLRATESPPVTRLTAAGGEILVDRRDFPPNSPRPGLPAPDLHFNFVLLATLFALQPRPWRGDRVAAFLIAAAVLAVVHVAALALEVRSVYATRLGSWSETQYGFVARNFWAAAFHFYLIAGRFAAPFAIWWPSSRFAREEASEQRRPAGVKRNRKRG